MPYRQFSSFIQQEEMQQITSMLEECADPQKAEKYAARASLTFETWQLLQQFLSIMQNNPDEKFAFYRQMTIDSFLNRLLRDRVESMRSYSIRGCQTRDAIKGKYLSSSEYERLSIPGTNPPRPYLSLAEMELASLIGIASNIRLVYKKSHLGEGIALAHMLSYHRIVPPILKMGNLSLFSEMIQVGHDTDKPGDERRQKIMTMWAHYYKSKGYDDEFPPTKAREDDIIIGKMRINRKLYKIKMKQVLEAYLNDANFRGNPQKGVYCFAVDLARGLPRDRDSGEFAALQREIYIELLQTGHYPNIRALELSGFGYPDEPVSIKVADQVIDVLSTAAPQGIALTGKYEDMHKAVQYPSALATMPEPLSSYDGIRLLSSHDCADLQAQNPLVNFSMTAYIPSIGEFTVSYSPELLEASDPKESLAPPCLSASSAEASAASYVEDLNPPQKKIIRFHLRPELASLIYLLVELRGHAREIASLSNRNFPDKIAKALELLGFMRFRIDFNEFNGYFLFINDAQLDYLIQLNKEAQDYLRKKPATSSAKIPAVSDISPTKMPKIQSSAKAEKEGEDNRTIPFPLTQNTRPEYYDMAISLSDNRSIFNEVNLVFIETLTRIHFKFVLNKKLYEGTTSAIELGVLSHYRNDPGRDDAIKEALKIHATRMLEKDGMEAYHSAMLKVILYELLKKICTIYAYDPEKQCSTQEDIGADELRQITQIFEKLSTLQETGSLKDFVAYYNRIKDDQFTVTRNPLKMFMFFNSGKSDNFINEAMKKIGAYIDDHQLQPVLRYRVTY